MYRNDRGILGGDLFIAVQSELVSVEQPEAVIECEVEWVEIKLKKTLVYIIIIYAPLQDQ